MKVSDDRLRLPMTEQEALERESIMKGQPTSHPRTPNRRSSGTSRAALLRKLIILLLGLMSILAFLGRLNIAPKSLLPAIFRSRAHQPQITQLTHLSPSLIPATVNNRRLIVVGDVHGCKHELEKLLHKVSYNKHTDHLILSGDMIDKGPSSHGVIKLARKLGASCVRGNHEDKVLALRELHVAGNSTLDGMSSQKQIGESTLASELSNKDLDWLAQCPLILKVGEIPSLSHASTVVVVHAGLVPGIPLLDQDPFAVMHMRSIAKTKKKFMPKEGRDEGAPWWKVWNREQELIKRHGTMVIYGHDSRTGLNQQKWSLGLDSGCVGGGDLSAVIIDNKDTKVMSVKCKNYR